MRVSSCLVAAVVLIGCAHGGFVTGGVHNVWPVLDETSGADVNGVAGTVGGGVALRGADLPGDDSNPTYLEGWVQYGDISANFAPGVEVGLTTAGVGLRFPIGHERIGERSGYTDFYLRVGALYQHAEGDRGSVRHGWGPYVGIGRNIYLNEARTLSLAPEFLVAGTFRGNDQNFLHATAGVTLIWRFGGSSKESTIERKR